LRDDDPQHTNPLTVDIATLRRWLGRTESRSDRITCAPAAALSATLDRDDPEPAIDDPLPLLGHWLYFLPLQRQSEIGPDGHPNRGGFLPPVPLPRRMWAGGRLRFHHPLRIGNDVSRVSQIVDVSHKDGRSGPLVFVLVRHEISNDDGVALTEEHDIVYRDLPRTDVPAPTQRTARNDHEWEREIRPDDVLLFRYSALTFNGHRIHYDRRYVTTVEGYPGLVVHGPLIATLLVDLVRRNLPGASIASFAFRAVKPLFDTGPFAVRGRVESDGRTVALWARGGDGSLAMDATAMLH